MLVRVNCPSLTHVVKYDNYDVVWASRRRKTRPVSWIKASLRKSKGFRKEPSRSVAALTIAAEGGTAAIAYPVHGMGPGVFEIALPFRGDAFRLVYAVQLADEIWVVHAFQKKSTQGSKTPKREVDWVKDRLKRLKEMLQ
ncbi:MAG TPA: type II toxin-antitoxin system RelE/ParE family toxin [Bryobacteraceae bacterium]|jgi:phage-related protein|nr:type II toxin-antitoxin system RelE/ParE family toxin [Bryobacteraceae bacterium]